MTTAVAVVSGGMDSTTAAYQTAQHHDRLVVLSVDYGQRHRRELDMAATTAGRLDAPHVVVDLSTLRDVLPGSALTDGVVDVPEGHYAADSMKATVVPNRNAILLAVAFGHAHAIGADTVVVGVHAGDHPVYPDCRPEFINAFAAMERLALDGGPTLHAPFVALTKADIVRVGHDLGVDWTATWSCYKGGDVHCGRCSTCVERIEAFHLAGVPDPTAYLDADYWRTVVTTV